MTAYMLVLILHVPGSPAAAFTLEDLGVYPTLERCLEVRSMIPRKPKVVGAMCARMQTPKTTQPERNT